MSVLVIVPSLVSRYWLQVLNTSIMGVVYTQFPSVLRFPVLRERQIVA